MVLFGQKFILSGEMLSWGAIFTINTIFIGFNFSVLSGMGKVKEKVKMLALSTLVVVVVSVVAMLSI